MQEFCNQLLNSTLEQVRLCTPVISALETWRPDDRDQGPLEYIVPYQKHQQEDFFVFLDKERPFLQNKSRFFTLTREKDRDQSVDSGKGSRGVRSYSLTTLPSLQTGSVWESTTHSSTQNSLWMEKKMRQTTTHEVATLWAQMSSSLC